MNVCWLFAVLRSASINCLYYIGICLGKMFQRFFGETLTGFTIQFTLLNVLFRMIQPLKKII